MTINEKAMKALKEMNVKAQEVQDIGDKVFRGEALEVYFNELRKTAEDLKRQISIWESEIPVQNS